MGSNLSQDTQTDEDKLLLRHWHRTSKLIVLKHTEPFKHEHCFMCNKSEDYYARHVYSSCGVRL